MPDRDIIYRTNEQGGVDASVISKTANAFFRADNRATHFLFDPDRPQTGPNELYSELGQMRDPNLVNHNCPFCHRTMSWELFGAHMKRTKEGPGCFERWYKTVDPRFRTFTGASIGEGNG